MGRENKVEGSRDRGCAAVLTEPGKSGSGRRSEKMRGKKLNRGATEENGRVRAGSTFALA